MRLETGRRAARRFSAPGGPWRKRTAGESEGSSLALLEGATRKRGSKLQGHRPGEPLNAGSSDQSRAAHKWLLSLGVSLWMVTLIALAVFHLGVETVVSRNEAFLRDLPAEYGSQPSFQSLPAFLSQLRLARSLLTVALFVALIAVALVRRFRSGVSAGTVVAGSGLFVAACTIAGLLWAMVLATAPV